MPSRCHPFPELRRFPLSRPAGVRWERGPGGEVLLNGATLYPSNSQADHRPAWPHDAADLLQQGRIHEVTALHPGQRIELVSLDHPTNGTPAQADAYLLCRRP